ncbi:ABC transporter permease [Pseudonocardia zijingensis]|jgi:putative spermidine/putrescine transport system permease protein|uniref:ABC transporter permease n=1 Tax=Pseudonocardia zijingensis TaxID=153376 RepID=A0ABN1N723_9PSEU
MATALTLPGPGAARGLGSRAWLALYVPGAALLALCFGYPLLNLLGLSLATPGLGNYVQLWDSPVFGTVLLRTFTTSAVVCTVCLVLGYPYAYAMTVVSPRLRDLLLVIVLVPLWTSLMVRTFSWLVLLQDNGIVNAGLTGIGVGPLPLIRNSTGVTIGMAQVMLPFAVLPMYAIMQKIDRRLLQAAASCGARPTAAFLRIYVPLSLPGVLVGLSLVFVLSLGFFITPQMLGSPSNALLSQLIYTQITQLGDGGTGAAMGFVLLLTTLLVLAAMVGLRRVAARSAR